MVRFRHAATITSGPGLLVLIILVAGTGAAAAGGADQLTGPYFGQQPPGLKAEVFAPDLVSQNGRYEFAISFAPGGERLLFTVQTADEQVQVMQSGVVDGFWTPPEPVNFTAGARRDEMEAFFAPDGKYIYFAPYNEGLDVRIWRVEVAGDNYIEPAPLTGPFEAAPAFYPTSASSGAIYYTNIAERKPYRARRDGDGAWQTEPLGLEFGGHTFVAPDESFVLVDARADDSRGKGDIYVAFAKADGWTTPVNLGDGVNSGYSESCPSLSDDGRFLFFSRYDEPNEVAQIYWVDSRVIEDARQRQLIEQTVYDSIAWALTKDRARLESIIAHDDDYFSFHPDGLDGVHGYAEFERGFDLWMDPRFEATKTDMRQFRCRLSASGEVAWFSAILDDCYIWDERPGCWRDTRWTGVLEKRGGRWLIVQMHFSFAADSSSGAPAEAEDHNGAT
jgi:Tol biopolymer transport system component